MTLIRSYAESLTRNSRWLWFSPVILFLLATAAALSPILLKGSPASYLAVRACAALACILVVINAVEAVNALFAQGGAWADNVSGFYSIGYGFLGQFFCTAAVLLSAPALCALFLIFIPGLSAARVLLMLPPFVLSLVFFRLLGLWCGFPALVYAAVPLLALSAFFPVYLLPNPVFVLKGDPLQAILYIFLCSALYSLVDVKLSSAWPRTEFPERYPFCGRAVFARAAKIR